MRKPNLQSPLDRLDDAQQHKLFELLKGASYEEALPKVRAEFGVRTTVSSLSRFVKRRAHLEELRERVHETEAFEDSEEVQALDRRTRAAVVNMMWEALGSKDARSIAQLGRLLVSMEAGHRADEQLKLDREKFEAAERRLERVAEIADAARGGKVDPAQVADEIDRILGRKK